MTPIGTLSRTDIESNTVGTRCSTSHRLFGVKLEAPEEVLAMFIIKVVKNSFSRGTNRS